MTMGVTLSEAADIDKRLQSVRRILEDVHNAIEFASQAEQVRQAATRAIEELTARKDELAAAVEATGKALTEAMGAHDREVATMRKSADKELLVLTAKVKDFERRAEEAERSWRQATATGETAHKARSAELAAEIKSAEDRLTKLNEGIAERKRQLLAI